jgi:RNA polymerase sigma factor for flagellar operon FliA
VPDPPDSAARRGVAGPGAEDAEVGALWRRYRAGDPDAKERLVLTYAPLVKWVAGRMRSALPPHVEESDLISYGLEGLIFAIERFDPKREVRFETFAASRIKGAIIDELRALDWVPRSIRARAREIERTASELEHKLKRAPTEEELARALRMDLGDFRDLISQIASSSIVALDDNWNMASGDAPHLLETISDDRASDPASLTDSTDLRDTLSEAIARLPEREKAVVALYYYDNLTLREIGEVLGVTESRVSQLHTKAILRLKGSLREAVKT